ncbi:hypothetical protein D9615_000030 [Tricholomella constricta]|uniref:ribonuclease H n=1 Tax=Tricholomella constricta TaxID=117010 RepID=A0A8H5HRV3_9AGAR|nr:hypothetical protein D9615_000030 [Tricholomella constricta]
MIIPIGSAEFRRNMIESRQLNPTENRIPDNVRIAPDGEPVRILGCYVGNGVEEASIWTPTLEKIHETMSFWDKSHPSQDGRKLIIDMETGGRTQFKARVQGMPDQVTDKLNKLTRDFLWGPNSTPAVGADTLSLPRTKGGKKVLDIKIRNQAIELVKLRSYLQFDEKRPKWAKVADEHYARNISTTRKTRNDSSLVAMFIQDWTAKTREGNTSLPMSLRTMLKAAKKHKLAFAPKDPTTHLKNQMPIWYHIGTKPTKKILNNDEWARCHRNTHKITTTGHMAHYVNEQMPPRHKVRKNCACQVCKAHRSKGCKNPTKCKTAATKTLDCIEDKWDPRNPNENDSQRPEDDVAEYDNAEHEDTIMFDPSFAEGESLADGFRIFVEPDTITHERPLRAPLTRPIEADVIVYTDGSCINNGCEDAKAGSGLWYGPDDARNLSLRLPDTLEQTNNTGEAVAILVAAQRAGHTGNLIIRSDSQITIDGLTENLPKWEEKGWIGIANKEILKATVATLRQRAGNTIFQKVKGHSNDPGNDGADRLAGLGARKELPDLIDLSIPPALHVSGAKISKMSQALLYSGILETRTPTVRRSTLINLDMTRHAVHALTGTLPKDPVLWKSIRNRHISKNISAYLWKVMHNAYKCGKYWDNIPDCERRGQCQECETEESMEHILTECQNTGQSVIWQLVNKIFEEKKAPQLTPSIGAVLGCGAMNFRDQNQKADPGLSRFYTIIVSESAHLIWKLRCEWKIGREADPDKLHTKDEIQNKWLQAINKRLKFDCLMTDKNRYGRKALRPSLVKNTWKGVLRNEEQLPINWTYSTGVLVGMSTARPPGRNR